MTTEQLLKTAYAVFYTKEHVGIAPDRYEKCGIPMPSLDRLGETHSFVGIFFGTDEDDIFYQLNHDADSDVPRSMSPGDIVISLNERLICDAFGWRPL